VRGSILTKKSGKKLLFPAGLKVLVKKKEKKRQLKKLSKKMRKKKGVNIWGKNK